MKEFDNSIIINLKSKRGVSDRCESNLEMKLKITKA